MIRFSAASACICCAAFASFAHAQSYPYAAQQAAYGYGPNPQAAMYGAPGGPGMNPAMYPPPGMAPGGMMPPGGAGGGMMQPSMEPGMQGPGMAGAMNVTPGRYRVPGNAAPPMKLPRGVTAEDGLLFYNGSPHAQQASFNPYQMSASQQGGEGAPPQTMPPSSPNGNVNYSGMADGGGCNGNCGGNCGGDCRGGNCGGGCCGLWGPHSCFGHFFGFPGKYGYVWSAGVEVLAMTRDADTDVVVVQNTDTLDTVFNSRDLDFGWEAGGRARLKLMGPSGIAVEGVYMRMAKFEAEANVEGNNDLQIPFPLAGALVDFFGADDMQLRYTSAIQSAELNVIYPFGNFQLLGGYRYFSIDETFNLRSTDRVDAGTSDYTTDVFNKMNGGQIGLLGQWQAFGMLNFDFDVKFGIFGDSITQSQVVRDLDNTVIARSTVGEKDGVAYVTELGIRAVVPLGATFNVTCGYNVFFIDRVALAPDQLDFSNDASSGTQVRQSGDIVMQGVTVGLNARW
jgi:hypothetical protein